jgi:hypothetical protein
METVTAREILATPDLIAVGIAGDEVRRRMHGSRTTFVRVLEVHVEVPLRALPPGSHAGEIRVVGTPASLAAARAAVHAAVVLAGEVPVTGFSVADLIALGPLDATVRELAREGLSAIAQLPIDAVADPEVVVRQIREAGLTVNAVTVDRLEDDKRIETCERVTRLQAAGAGVKAFAPLPRTMSVTKPTTGYDDVKMVSLARVVVTNIPSIQVDWPLYGPKLAQVALTVGADDVDLVSAIDPGVLGTRRSPIEEIRGNIRSAHLDAVERDGLFRTVDTTT